MAGDSFRLAYGPEGEGYMIREKREVNRKDLLPWNPSRGGALYLWTPIHQIDHFNVYTYFYGASLREIISCSTLNDAEIARIIRGVLRGLKLIHSHGFVHRNISPATILIRTDGRVLIGSTETICQAGKQAEAIGDAWYKSPQEARGLAYEHSSDLWKLGISIFEAVNCIPPDFYRSSSQMERLLSSSKDPSQFPDLQQGGKVHSPQLQAFYQGVFAKSVEKLLSDPFF